MRLLLIPLFLINIFDFLCSKKNHNVTQQTKAKDYFGCDYYNYFPDEGYPRISKKDSVDLIKYAIQKNLIKDAIRDKDTVMCLLAHKLPFIKGIFDTSWYEKVVIAGNYDKKFAGGLKDYQLEDIIRSEATIIGKVIDKKYLYDTTKCFKFKVIYIIRVEEVLHSYFPLKKDDLVMVYDILGPAGGCSPNLPEAYLSASHMYAEYRKDALDIFLLWRWNYYRAFICFDLWTGDGIPYQDNYCRNAFTLNPYNSDYSLKNKEIYEDIKKFVNYWKSK